MNMHRKNDIPKIYYYLIDIITVIIIWCLICALKRIYPFGNNSMCEGDYKAQILAVFAHVWDCFHGKSALFFDWCQGLGNNLTGTIWHFGILSPSSIFFLFVPREYIEHSAFFFILIKLIAVSLSFGFVVRRLFPHLPRLLITGLVLLYVFCPFNMEYYLIPNWIDIACLFPLVIYYLLLLFEKGKTIGFTIVLTMFIMLNFQLSYVLAIHLITLVSLLLILNKDKFKTNIWRFVISCIFSCLIDAWLIIPGILQTMTAQRMDSNRSFKEIMHSVWAFNPDKWFKISNLIIPLLFFGICCYFKLRKDKKFILFSGMIFFISAPIVLESTNLLYHGGSYESFTMRFAFMITFWVLIGAAYAYNDMCTSITNLKAASIISILFLALSIYLSTLIANRSILVAYDLNYSVLRIANEIYKTGQYSADPYSRVKVDSSLCSNLNQMGGFASIQNYTVSQNSDQIDSFTGLGYASVGYRMDDRNGTAFTDALFGFKYVFSGNIRDYSIYESDFVYEPGILLKDCSPIKPPYKGGVFEVQNALYEAMTGEKLLYEVPQQNIIIKDDSRLYCYIPTDAEYKHVYVQDKNDEILSDICIEDVRWNNGIINLGDYSDISVSVNTSTGDVISCALMNLVSLHNNSPMYAEKFTYTVSKHSMQIAFNNELFEDGYDHLFIPIYPSAGFRCTVNGRFVDPIQIGGGMAIPTETGSNDIIIKFALPGFGCGIIISIITLIGFITALIIVSVKKDKTKAFSLSEELISKFLYSVIMLLFAIVLILFYILPIMFFVVNVFSILFKTL